MTDKVKEGTLLYTQVRRDDELPAIATPPTGLVRMAFFTAIRYRSMAGAIKAYNSAVNELAYTEEAFTRLKASKLEHERVIRLLEDAESIHAVDAHHRKVARMEAEASQDETEHKLYLRKMEREKERKEAEQKHAEYNTGKPVDQTTLTDEEREFAEAIGAKAQPARYRQIAENLINEYVKSKGTLTAEDNAYIQSIRDACEEAIRDMS